MNAKYAELLKTLAEKVNSGIVPKSDIEKLIGKLKGKKNE